MILGLKTYIQNGNDLDPKREWAYYGHGSSHKLGISMMRAVQDKADFSAIVKFDLQQVVRSGFPLKTISADSALLRLRGVIGRASDKSDRGSLIAALDGLLRLLLAQLPNKQLQVAAELLFGVVKESVGKTLTSRRELASTASKYEAHHFRKRIEPSLITSIASALVADSESYNRNRAAAPNLIRETRRPSALPEDALAWEAVEHEENMLRIWAAIYSLRSQLIRIQRLVSMGTSRATLHQESFKAFWLAAVLVDLGEKYRIAYGERLVQNDSEINLQDLVNLAGWTPALSATDKYHIVRSTALEDQAAFLSELQSKPDRWSLFSRWRDELCEIQTTDKT